MKNANEEIALIVQCEHKDAVDNLPEIVEVDGIDCIFIGPYDLSASMGKTGKFHDQEVIDSIAKIEQQCKAKNIPLGIFGGTSEAVKPYKNRGFTLLTAGIDVLMISSSAKEILNKMRD